MPAAQTDFDQFLMNIRLPEAQKKGCQDAHQEIRERLLDFEETKGIIIGTFLQGSYRRETCIAPANGKKSDIDLVVATCLHEGEHNPPSLAWAKFAKFLKKYYPNRYKPHARSVQITFGDDKAPNAVELDLVITSAPSEAVFGMLSSNDLYNIDPLLPMGDIGGLIEKRADTDNWKREVLRIPDREQQYWEDTHPLAQILWTRQKNASTNGHYTHTVMALKWWQRINGFIVRPKGYTLEAIVGECCPDNITNIEEGIYRTLYGIVENYKLDVANQTVPTIPDVGTGLNVLERVSWDEFRVFYIEAQKALKIANQAQSVTREDACILWRRLLGNAFPSYQSPPESVFTPPNRVANVKDQRFA